MLFFVFDTITLHIVGYEMKQQPPSGGKQGAEWEGPTAGWEQETTVVITKIHDDENRKMSHPDECSKVLHKT